jgi:redox-sensitive bicupin YhaK (pirin superfamily)
MRVIAGSAFGATAPVKVASPTFSVDAVIDAGAELVLPDEYAERAAYVVEGAIECDGQTVDAATVAVASGGVRATIRALRPSRVMILGGEPTGKRYIWWNFVASPRSVSSERSANGRKAHSRRCLGMMSSSSRCRSERG